ncbi:MAG: DUF4163 domain-containing protein [Blastocatellia bacterium]
MNKIKLLSIVLILLLSFSLFSCKNSKNSTSSNDSNNPTQPNEEVSKPNKASVAAPRKFNKVLVGKVDKYNIFANLQRNEKELYGTYRYESNKAQIVSAVSPSILSLSGNVEDDGSFTLTETEFVPMESGPVNKETGKFAGKLLAEERDKRTSVKLNGNWTKADGSRTFNFFLYEKTFSVGDKTQIIDKEIKEEDKAKKYSFNLTYPQIQGSNQPNVEKFNQEVAAKVQKIYQEFKTDTSESETPPYVDLEASSYYDGYYLIEFASKDLISVVFYSESYYLGAVHPNTSVMAFNFNLNTGQEIKLEDLFLKNSNYLEKIDKICSSLTKDIDTGFFFDTTPPKENIWCWNITERGIYLHFGIAHVYGDVGTISIPYNELKDVIDLAGPMSSLVTYK